MESLYDILGVSTEATEKEIKAAYKKLALLYHPDRNPHDKEAEEKFKAINNAYQILSDPLKKQQYDLLRKHPYFYQSHSYSHTYQTTYQQSYRQAEESLRRRTSWTYTAEDRRKDEELARKWMLGFFLVVTLITIAVYGFLDWKDRWDTKKALEKKMLLIEKVEKQSTQSQYEESLVELKKMREATPNDDDIKLLYQKTLKKLEDDAEIAFLKKDYEKALHYFMLIRQYEEYPNTLNLFKIAYSYKGIGDIGKSAEYLEMIVTEQPNNLRAHIDLAYLFLETENFPRSTYHFDKAVQIIVQHYKEVYGEAYAVLINPKNVSDIHYEAFVGKAFLNIKKKDYEKALKDCTWAIYLREQLPDAYLLKAEALFELKRDKEAILALKDAQKLGAITNVESILAKYYKPHLAALLLHNHPS